MTLRGVISCSLASLALFSISCGRPASAIIIGSQNGTEQSIVGEIVAQHVERRLGHPVARRPSIGGTLLAYQGLQSGDINIYPEYTGTIITEILKEQPTDDPNQGFERAKSEMQRLAQAQLLNPLGIDGAYVAVIRKSGPHAAALSSLSDAAQVSEGWKLGYSYEFQQRSDAMPALTQYHLPMSVPMRAMDNNELFKAMADGQLTIILVHPTEGSLRSGDWKFLRDDRSLFTPERLCLLVRQDVLKAEPRLAAALAELSGKFTNEKMRQLNAQVEVDHRTVAEVAKGFLAGVE